MRRHLMPTRHAAVTVNPLPGTLETGALVRTRRASQSGLHRAVVLRVFERDGERWAEGQGWSFPARELEVIRGAVVRVYVDK